MMKTGSLILASTALLLTGAAADHEADAFDQSFGTQGATFLDRFSFGSYGELHGRVNDGEDNLDMHRLVALMNFQINPKLRLVSETEFEHVFYHEEGTGRQDMEIEVEQLYLEYALADDLLVNAGIQLVPVGLVSVTHEPTTFFGVERPNVEKYIIPSTWWEGGVGVVKTYDSGLQVDVLLHSAMDMDKDGYIRSGRPKLDLNEYTGAQSWGLTGRAKYTGIAGVELAGTVQYQDDVSDSASGEQRSYLAETHAIYRKGGFELRGLAAYWNLDGFAESDSQDQWGYYLEPSYRFDIPWGKLGYFARFSQYEYFNTTRREIEEFSVGLNYWPIDELVMKVDYTNSDPGRVNHETFNLGLGYFF